MSEATARFLHPGQVPDGAPRLPSGVALASSPKEDHPEHPRQTPWTVTRPGTIHNAPLIGPQQGSHSTNLFSTVLHLTVLRAGASAPQPSQRTPSVLPGRRTVVEERSTSATIQILPAGVS
jgi:hypothetical protein